MQTDNRLFDDLAKVANGALHTMSGVRDELETRLRERVERWLTDMDMVPREEFEAIKSVAQKARSEQEKLVSKVEALESRIAALEKARPTRAATRKPASKKPRKSTPRRPAAKAKADD
ncbi:MAG: accessory factor UbiK family protein [Geminicoccaceae bacterium]|jgi:BMFP domain-containing protein YqiC